MRAACADRVRICGACVAVLFSACACGDEGDACEELESRCSADGKAVEYCVPQNSCEDSYGFPCTVETRWERKRECVDPYPVCSGPSRYATCTGAIIGECDFSEFTDKCEDAHTLVECVVMGDPDFLTRVACPEGTTCAPLSDEMHGARHNTLAGYKFWCETPATDTTRAGDDD